MLERPVTYVTLYFSGELEGLWEDYMIDVQNINRESYLFLTERVDVPAFEASSVPLERTLLHNDRKCLLIDKPVSKIQVHYDLSIDQLEGLLSPPGEKRTAAADSVLESSDYFQAAVFVSKDDKGDPLECYICLEPLPVLETK